MKRLAYLGLIGVALQAACIFPTEDRGRSKDANAGGSSNHTHPPPEVTSFTPTEGDYGSTVTILGTGLGGDEWRGQLIVGSEGALVFDSYDFPAEEWSEEQIRFRFPFPAQGVVSVETPEGAAVAGEFSPSWRPGQAANVGPGASVLTAISPAAGEIAVVLDTTPPTLVHFQEAITTQTPMVISGHQPETLRLYLNDLGELEGVALSNTSPPELLHLVNQDSALTALSTGVTLSSEFAIGAGAEGAVVWYREGDDWTRVRPGAGGWAVDKGPIADPAPTAADHAAAATSDGTLWIARSQDSGTFLDDMERPVCASLAPDATGFTSFKSCGSSMDDYITTLELESRGAGVIVSYCGTDVDPVGTSGNELLCRTGAVTVGGVVEERLPADESLRRRYTFSPNLISSAVCAADTLDLIGDISSAAKQSAIWPCPDIVALELDASGDFVYVVRLGDTLYAPRRRE